MARKEFTSLAAKLKKLREAQKLSQQDLAVKAGLSISVVSQIEQGKKQDPRTSTMLAIADALGVSVHDLMGQPPRKKR
jgi:transcriptional regulator with XRE-family HTH domain